MSRKILFSVGFLLLAIPLMLQFWETRHQENVISTYWEEIDMLEDSELEHCLKNAREYNTKLYSADEVLMIEYDDMLNLSDDGIMGSVEIPKISLKLPIYHGTTEEVLSKGIGHLKESSLPVGGSNVHSVLTGHRGLPNAQLFTRLDEMEKNDIFFIRVCNEVLTYQVKAIQVVKPEDVEVLEIQTDKDLVSLITCTPYGLNTHRLVVTGERVGAQEIEKIEEVQTDVNLMSKRDIVLLVILIIFLLMAIAKWRRSKNKKSKKKQLVSMIMVLFMLVFPMETSAAEGSVEIVLPEDDQIRVLYSKVGALNNDLFILEKEYEESNINLNTLNTARELEKAASKLNCLMKNPIALSSEGKSAVSISGLEEGVYLFRIEGKKNWNPILVYVPTWMESEGLMGYDITMIPKCGEKISSPKTGWSDFIEYYLILFLISFIIIVRLSCHNRFKCGKIPHKYSQMGGYTNGNDNDTKNPRCPRRIGFSGCRPIN